jgi:ABC-type multidrug transport system fused ATPase/permease subunit
MNRNKDLSNVLLYKRFLIILDLLPKHFKFRLIKVCFFLIINSVIDLLGLAALIPLFTVLLEEDILTKYTWAAYFYDLFGMTDERQLIIFIAAVLFLIIVIKNILSLKIARYNTTFAYSLYTYYSLKLHQHYYSKGFHFFKDNNSNHIVRDLKFATNQFASALVLGFLNLINELLVLILILIFMAYYDFKILLLLLIVVVPPFYLFYRWVRLRSTEIGKTRAEIDPVTFKYMYQSIFGYIDIIISGAETNMRKKISESLKKLINADVNTNVYNLAPTKVIESALILGILVIITYGLYFYPSKNDLLSLLILFAIAGYRILPSVNRIMIAVNGVNQFSWTVDVIKCLKNDSEENLQSDGIENLKDINFNHYLKLQEISFRYSSEHDFLFDNYSLKINKGEVIGITGSSGSGKTTLMNILLGFIKPSSGKFFIDNEALTTNNLRAYHNKIGYVQQQVYIIDATLAENVAFGIELDQIDVAKVKEALKKASLWEVVSKLPEGIDEMIGENGAKLSGGQRQRIGIARALYFDAEILFFDEATSALDDETEKEITESIRKLSDGELTIIIIAHRLTTLEYCDRIIKIGN